MEREKLKVVLEQIVHDLRSPLVTLSIVVESLKDVPAEKLVLLKKATDSISCIANSLLDKYKYTDGEIDRETGIYDCQDTVIFVAMLDIINKYKYRYDKLGIEFNYSFEAVDKFMSVHGCLSSFNQMMSHLINDFVNAFGGGPGSIDLIVKIDGKCVKIAIKADGNGIELFSQIDTKKENNYIKLRQMNVSITSSERDGTEATITLPISEYPKWLAMKILLHKRDVVVVLDDDHSICHVWEDRFKGYYSDISFKYFSDGQSTVNFINSSKEKKKIFLLCDFDLRDQPLNGATVIQKSNISGRSILVSSMYGDRKVQKFFEQSGVKILPKPLINEATIIIENTENSEKS